jgi:hypothetical protein
VLCATVLAEEMWSCVRRRWSRAPEPEFGDDLIAKERYTRPDFARLGCERMWTHKGLHLSTQEVRPCHFHHTLMQFIQR